MRTDEPVGSEIKLSEVFPPDDGSSPEPTPSEPTCIVMMSLPDSQDSNPEYQTPPERPLSLPSSEEQKSPVVDDTHDDQKIDDGGCGFDWETVVVDDVLVRSKGVDLSKDSDNVMLPVSRFTQEYHDDKCPLGDVDWGVPGNDDVQFGSENQVLKSESIEPIVEKSHGSKRKLAIDDVGPASIGSEDIVTKFIDIEVDPNGETHLLQDSNAMNAGSPIKQSRENVKANCPQEINNKGNSVTKRKEDIDKFMYVGSRQYVALKKPKDGQFENFLNVLTAVKELMGDLIMEKEDDGLNNEDVLEVAKRFGLTFSKPPWFSSQGCEDD